MLPARFDSHFPIGRIELRRPAARRVHALIRPGQRRRRSISLDFHTASRVGVPVSRSRAKVSAASPIPAGATFCERRPQSIRGLTHGCERIKAKVSWWRRRKLAVDTSMEFAKCFAPLVVCQCHRRSCIRVHTHTNLAHNSNRARLRDCDAKLAPHCLHCDSQQPARDDASFRLTHFGRARCHAAPHQSHRFAGTRPLQLVSAVYSSSSRFWLAANRPQNGARALVIMLSSGECISAARPLSRPARSPIHQRADAAKRTWPAGGHSLGLVRLVLVRAGAGARALCAALNRPRAEGSIGNHRLADMHFEHFDEMGDQEEPRRSGRRVGL
jgi:hypothetical protein